MPMKPSPAACPACALLRVLFRTPLAVLSWLLRAVAKGLRVAAWTVRIMADLVEFIRMRFFHFTPRPDDIFISAYPRSGTTMSQMMLYQLTTDGAMTFSHISEVCPWFERALGVTRRDLDAMPSPRVFKTHLSYRLAPKGACKYIYLIRDGRDVAVSYFHLHRTHTWFRGTFDRFFARFMRGWVPWGSWFRHVSTWTANPKHLNILYLHYEEIVADMEGAIRKIAAFCGLVLKPEDLPRLLERSSFAFMKEHEVQFDYHTERALDSGHTPAAFIRSGCAGAGRTALSEEQARRFDEEYRAWFS
jgi:hypothetical protein